MSPAVAAHHPTSSDARPGIWNAIATLTRATRHRIDRDDGTKSWVIVPSLWQQAETALHRPIPEGGRNASPARERTLIDLDLLELCAIIADTTGHELAARRIPTTGLTVPVQLRRLAGHVIAHDPAQLWWWEYRFASWARLLSTALHLGERQPTPVRLRNSACPNCHTRHATIEGADGPHAVPALVVEFRDGLIRSARCLHCAAQWWRGAELEHLANVLDGLAPALANACG